MLASECPMSDIRSPLPIINRQESAWKAIIIEKTWLDSQEFNNITSHHTQNEWNQTKPNQILVVVMWKTMVNRDNERENKESRVELERYEIDNKSKEKKQAYKWTRFF